MPGQERDKLETRLIRDSWVNPANFIKAKDEQVKSGKSLYSTLIRMGYVTQQRVYEFFSQSAMIPFVRIADYKLDEKLLKLFPEASYRENCFLPLAKIDEIIYICMANPLDANLVSTLELQSNSQVCPLFSAPGDIDAQINNLFGPDDRYFDLENLIVTPQATSVMPFWRESDRMAVTLDMEIMIADDRVRLISSVALPASGVDVSASGKAIGAKIMFFIPQGVQVEVKFPNKDKEYLAKATVVRCTMDKGGKYIIGLKFTEIKEELLASIVGDGRKI
jgi:hypothetical protein